MRATYLGGIGVAALAGAAAFAQSAPAGDPDARAAEIVSRMTLDEQIQLVNGQVGSNNPLIDFKKPEGAIPASGFVRGVPRLGIPSLAETDGGQGVANRGEKRKGDEATQLPSGLALAATFDPDLVERTATVLGAEARAKGLNVVLGGIAAVVREPRGGRNFEAAGEDPLLVGKTVAAMIRGTQSQGVVSTAKHFIVNVQETGRSVQNAVIDEAALRQSDLLAFQIAVQEGAPGSIMTGYNRINGTWNSESGWLLNGIVKGEWGFKGWIMSDWGATHSTIASAMGGLDQESGREFDTAHFFDAPLKQAVQAGQVPMARLADMNRRIVRSLIATGVYDRPAVPGGAIDWSAHAELAQRAAEQGIVLLKNDRALLPLASRRKIVVIGGHADKGVPTGGGSAQVIPHGGITYRDLKGDDLASRSIELLYAPSVPLSALRAEMPDADISFDDGADTVRAAAAAKAADVAIVFAVKPSAEGLDSSDLSLPDGQDALIAQVAAANTNTVVVLETGNVVTMPWAGKVKAIVAAWYPGQRGAEALAAILSGRIAPSGHSPVSFPRGLAELPRPVLPGWRADVGVDLAIGKRPEPFDIVYSEGSDVGYRWYERSKRRPLFAFGRGLTYTRFRYHGLSAVPGPEGTLAIRFTVTNAGKRAGVAVPQVYAAPPGQTHRLVGWSRVTLAPGESRPMSIRADRRLLATYGAKGWRIAAGRYHIQVAEEAGSALLQNLVGVNAFEASVNSQR